MHSLITPSLDQAMLWNEQERTFLVQHVDHNEADYFKLQQAGVAISSRNLMHQLQSRRKAKSKWPFLFQHEAIVYPPALNQEQSSSEQSARFKASLVSGDTFIDLSAGMGIDSFFLSESFKHGILVERDEQLARITAHNFAVLQRTNIQIASGMDASVFLKEYDKKVDLIYIDPARRNQAGLKTVRWKDCSPNVVELLPNIWKLTSRLMLKASPLLDIEAACNELGEVSDVYVLAINQECKELIFLLQRGWKQPAQVHAVHLHQGIEHRLSAYPETEKAVHVEPASIDQFLYEPNPAIMKAGLFKTIVNLYPVHKLHSNTHLYTSIEKVPSFPGRCFKVLEVMKPDKKNLINRLPEMKANLSLRNFPGSVVALRKQLGLREGGEYYLFATTDSKNQKQLILCLKCAETD
jgi:hypothetical protein